MNSSDVITKENVDKIEESIKNKEKEILSIFMLYFPIFTKIETRSKLLSYIKDNDLQELNDILTNRFVDFNVMKRLSEVLNTLAYTPNEIIPTSGLFHANYELKKYFSKYNLIGEPSAYGLATSTSIGNLDDKIIIKTPRNPQIDDLMHEIFIGILCTNRLRYKIPNFALLYGGFTCSIPLVSTSEKMVELCPALKTKSVTYAMYEKINGKSFANLLQRDNFSIESYLSVLSQIGLALHIARYDVKFTHYDLHTGNVICRDVNSDKQIVIKYPTHDAGDVYIVSPDNIIATFIDYGMSHVYYQGSHYGVTNFYKHGVYPNRERVSSDIFKFISGSLYDIFKSNNEQLQGFSLDLYKKLFGEIVIIDNLESQFISLYNGNKNDKIKDLTIDSIKKYLDIMGRQYFSLKINIDISFTEIIVKIIDIGTKEYGICFKSSENLNMYDIIKCSEEYENVNMSGFDVINIQNDKIECPQITTLIECLNFCNKIYYDIYNYSIETTKEEMKKCHEMALNKFRINYLDKEKFIYFDEFSEFAKKISKYRNAFPTIENDTDIDIDLVNINKYGVGSIIIFGLDIIKSVKENRGKDLKIMEDYYFMYINIIQYINLIEDKLHILTTVYKTFGKNNEILDETNEWYKFINENKKIITIIKDKLKFFVNIIINLPENSIETKLIAITNDIESGIYV